MHRYELTEAQWEKIAPFFPDRYHDGGAGKPWKDHRPLVTGILWRRHTAAPWPDIPPATAPGRPSTTASAAGGSTAPGPRFSTPSCCAWTRLVSSTVTSGWLMRPLFAPAEPRPGRKKKSRRAAPLGRA